MAKHTPTGPVMKKRRIGEKIEQSTSKVVRVPLKPQTDVLSSKGKGKEKAIEALPPALPPKPKAELKLKSKEDVSRVLPTTFKVIAGSYEKLLYGLEGTTTVDESANIKFHLKPEFIFPAHVSCIKAVAASPEGGKWLATGSADEIIKVWDLRRKKEIGGLMHHEGSITHLTFPSRSHLLSASEDGTLCLFRARDWSVLKALRGHKGRVNSIAVHPSGKLALSVGKDKTLRMWDLMRGKGSASTKLGKEGEIVRWSTDGSMFAIQAGAVIDLYKTDMTLLHTITHPSRLHDIRFCTSTIGKGEVLFAAAEDNKLSIYDLQNDPVKVPKIVARMIGHTNRVKAVQTLEIALPSSTSGRISTTIACTISSDGKIHLYDMSQLSEILSNPIENQNPVDISPLTEYDSKGTRLTCLALGDGETLVKGKRKRPDDVEDSDSADEGEENWEGIEEEEDESNRDEGEDEGDSN